MRTLVGAVVLVGMLALSGCTDGEGIPTLPPTPSSTPLFASEEEALVAAEEAYAAYQAAIDAALAGDDTIALEDFATGTALEAAQHSVEDFRQTGRFQVGETRVDSVAAVDLAPLLVPDADGIAQVYACLDLSQVAVSDSNGVTTQSSVPRLPMLVGLVPAGDAVLVYEEEVWDADNFCT